MKKISDVITEDLFVNAYNICKTYVESEYLYDINLVIVKNYIKSLTEKNVRDYYKNYIKTEKCYLIPFLFASEVVSIPKNINGLREYRYFTSMSMILYNAIGLLFAEVCNDLKSQIAFKKNKIFNFSPTSFNKNDKGEWIAKNEYQTYYKQYTEKIKEESTINTVTLKIDISNYFENINHTLLINTLTKYGMDSVIEKYNLDSKSKKAIEFYFESLMGTNHGIPQGKTNCVSDLLGELYLLDFDINVFDICKNDMLKFKSMIRYVDDIIINFEFSNTDERTIRKEISLIEQKLSNYFYTNLKLKINPNKTEVKILKSKSLIEDFLEKVVKKVSNKEKENNENTQKIENMYIDFKKSIQKYKYSNSDDNSINFKDKENLKCLFNSSFKAYINNSKKKEELSLLLKDIDFELTVNEINILILLFYLKDKKDNYLYNDELTLYLENNFNYFDKRIIHILLMMLTQNKDINESLLKLIVNSNKELLDDNYGKYLLLLTNQIKNKTEIDFLDKESIFNELIYEYINPITNYKRIFYPKGIFGFQSFVNSFIDSKIEDESIIIQLKSFVFNYRKDNWDSAFNHLQNTFHELCKYYFRLKDNDTVEKIIDKLYSNNLIKTKEEIIIRKFYDRRNFNLISHPSKNGKSSVKVSKESLDYYFKEIVIIMEHIITGKENEYSSNK